MSDKYKVVTVEVRAALRVSVRDLRAAGVSARDVRELLSVPNPDYFKKQRMGMWTGSTPRDLSLVERDGDALLLPRGALAAIRGLLAREGARIRLEDRTVRGTGPTGLRWRSTGWELGPDQRGAVRALLRRERGLLRGVCSSGKTSILLKVAADSGERTLVLVHTERILSDWRRAIEDHMGIPFKAVGVLYGKEKREDPRITVGMLQTIRNVLKRDPKWADNWGCVLCDEVHHFSATSFSEVISQFPAALRLGATATLKRKDGKEALMYHAFGAEWEGRKCKPRVLWEITDEDLDRHGRIVPVDVVVVPTDLEFDLHREAELEAAGWKRGDRENALASVKRWARSEGGPQRLNTYAEMLDTMADDPVRLARVLEYLLPEVKDGRTCLLLADRRELCLRVQSWLRRRGVEAGRLMGGRDAREQEKTVLALEDGSLRVAVGTTVADEGMNVKRLHAGFGLTPTASNPGRLVQQVGRFKRMLPGKASATFFYYWDRRVRALRGHARAVKNAISAPHRVWYSERPGERVELSNTLLRELEGDE